MKHSERIEEVKYLLTKPYLTTAEIAKLIDKSWSTTNNRLKANKDCIHQEQSWGWLTDDVIKVFELTEYKKMMMR